MSFFQSTIRGETASLRVTEARCFRDKTEGGSRSTEGATSWRPRLRFVRFTTRLRSRSSPSCAGASSRRSWPEQETVTDASQGVQLATIQELARYWATDYDWRKCEARLNALPQFITEIDGLDIHFIHVRSKHENALPLIVTHGWPGSIIEQLKIIEPADRIPRRTAASASDAFDVVIPSMPGYGFSGKPTTTGWEPARIARAWIVLMKRLGYTQFVAQGGDWGALVTDLMGVQAPPELLGIHTNMPGAVPPEIDTALPSRRAAAAGLSADETARVRAARRSSTARAWPTRSRWGRARRRCTGSRTPRSAWPPACSTTTRCSYELIARVFDGQAEGLTRDDVLDNITLSWLTNTAISSARLYWENKLAFFAAEGRHHPGRRERLPRRALSGPRSWAEQAYPKLIHYNKLDKGGHFAAWEQPKLLSSEMRAGFRSLRR